MYYGVYYINNNTKDTQMYTKQAVVKRLDAAHGMIKRTEFYIKSNDGNSALDTLIELKQNLHDIQTLVNRENDK